MSLTDEDLDKIQAVVSAGVELTRTYVDQRISESETRMELVVQENVQQSEERLAIKIENVKTMLQGDHAAVVEDLEKLKDLPVRVEHLEISRV
ncbi:MAG: hypothetical protein AAB701_01480 [Patescibacteria group bacterium]